MNHLRRHLAPVTALAWAEIESEAKASLTNFLAGRRIAEFDGPLGWQKASIATGRLGESFEVVPGVSAAPRLVRSLVELRTEFTLSLTELDAVERGASDIDLDAVGDAAKRAALAEDTLVFNGNAAANIVGIAPGSPHAPIAIGPDYADFATYVAQAVGTLRGAGVDGPYAVALGPRCYEGVIETTERGYPLLKHLGQITGGSVVYAPAVDGSVVISQRGDDFKLTVGEDFSIGYLDHDRETVTLYLEETMTFTNAAPEAAVALRYL